MTLTTTTTPESAADLVSALGGHGSSARCPAHDDHQASLSISDNPKGGLPLIKCHAGCAQRDVIGQLRARGLWPEKTPAYARRPGNGNGSNGNGHGPGRHLTIVATYDYRDADGALVYQVVRLEPKTFRQRRPSGDGPDSWIWNMKGVTRTLYHLPQLLAAVKAGRDAAATAGTAATSPTLYIVEGEKDVHAIESLGLVATTNTGGAGNGKWTAALSKTIIKAKVPRVVVIPDNDGDGGPGAIHAASIVRSLVAAGYPANRVSTLTLPATRDAKPVKDSADWVAAGGTRAELEDMVAESAVEGEPPPGVGEPAVAPGQGADPEPLNDFVRDADGKIVKAAIANIGTALDLLGVALWHDEFSDRTMAKVGDLPPRPIEDHDLDRWWIETDQKFRFRPPQTLWRTVTMDRARRNAFHPVREYIDSLTWDGTPRVDRWLIDTAGAEDTPYVRAVSAIVLIAAVRRVRQPGCKFDEMLVLEAPQGAAKSSALAALCPREDWFTDDLPLNCDSRQVIERTAGCWIVEAAELSGMRKSEVEQVKAFLSRRSDRARLAYAKLPVERPRHFVVVGTTNSSHYLRDTTGNRRFWPVQVAEFQIEAVLTQRDQLWAEASAREAAGESIRLPFALWAAAGQHQEDRRMVDSWEELLDEALGTVGGLLATEDAWRIVGHTDPSRRSQADNVRLAEIMTRLGFERKRRRRSAGRVYVYARGASESWIHLEDGSDQAQSHWVDD